MVTITVSDTVIGILIGSLGTFILRDVLPYHYKEFMDKRREEREKTEEWKENLQKYLTEIQTLEQECITRPEKSDSLRPEYSEYQKSISHQAEKLSDSVTEIPDEFKGQKEEIEELIDKCREMEQYTGINATSKEGFHDRASELSEKAENLKKKI